ncbi:transposase [Lentzea indica]|uniref:transposase n=1 Tax=Lentzea indica TaxID=2604800 RepID=UPI001FE63FE1|nr:transposase [Lentzea indica]
MVSWEDVAVPKPYPQEFRDDVVRVARDREPGVTVEQIAKDFGVHPMTLFKWLRFIKSRCHLNTVSGLTSSRSRRNVARARAAVRLRATPCPQTSTVDADRRVAGAGPRVDGVERESRRPSHDQSCARATARRRRGIQRGR